jgi:hypothetical protein
VCGIAHSDAVLPLAHALDLLVSSCVSCPSFLVSFFSSLTQRQPGLALILDQLLGFDGSEFYISGPCFSSLLRLFAISALRRLCCPAWALRRGAVYLHVPLLVGGACLWPCA